MTLNYSEEDYNNASESPGPIPEGEYDFIVQDAEEKMSKTGNQYVSLTISVLVNGKQRNLKYQTISFAPKALWRLKQFCTATNMKPPREAEQFLGVEGKCYVKEGDNGYPEVAYWGAGYKPKQEKKTTASNHPF